MSGGDGPLGRLGRWLSGAPGWTIGLATVAVSLAISVVLTPWGVFLLFAVFPFGLRRRRRDGDDNHNEAT
jgi:hypothetical protein